jgi:hypothetical protein
MNTKKIIIITVVGMLFTMALEKMGLYDKIAGML